MLTINNFNELDIEGILNITDRKQFHMHEYGFLSDNVLKDKFRNKLHANITSINIHSFTIKQDENIVGYIECQEDIFDTQYLGLNCFRISELIIINSEIFEIKKIVLFAIKSLKAYLKKKTYSGYLCTSLSNNNSSMQSFFNAFTESGFNYLHTLLTFSQVNLNKEKLQDFNENKENGVIIRNATEEDLHTLERIAMESFKFSRFHMDPLIDNEKASNLLKASIRNSLIEGFADVIFVAQYKNNVVGYYSGKKKYDSDFSHTIGEAIISAVSSEARGKGVFKLLNLAMLNWFSENTDFAEMGTYLVNFPIHKTWISNDLSLLRGTHQFSCLF